jgi:hypothetical protein
MAAAEGSRKLLCACGKPLAVFDAKGLTLYCRFSKETTTVLYGMAGLPKAMAFQARARLWRRSRILMRAWTIPLAGVASPRRGLRHENFLQQKLPTGCSRPAEPGK